METDNNGYMEACYAALRKRLGWKIEPDTPVYKKFTEFTAELNRDLTHTPDEAAEEFAKTSGALRINIVRS
jgi:hypothetical protein